MVHILQIMVDFTAVVLTGAISWLFWRIYRRRADLRIIIMALLFSFMTIYIGIHLILSEFIKLGQFEWMDSHLSVMLLWLGTLLCILYVIATGPAWKNRLKEKPEKPAEGPRKAA